MSSRQSWMGVRGRSAPPLKIVTLLPAATGVSE
jgi:hypothetical protein